MRNYVILVWFALAISLLGCQHVPKPASDSGVVSIDSIVVVEVWVSDKCPENGEIITARATVINKGTKTQVIDLKDRPVLDLAVGKVGEGAFPRWSDGKALTSDLTHLELQPGQSKTIQMTVTISDNTALYRAGATLYYSAKFPDSVEAGVSFAGPHGCSIIDLP